jgi:ParB family transcriptional regulator, chromosome partitioning protein
MGKRIDFAELASQPVLEAPVPRFPPAAAGKPAATPVRVALHEVATNPINPREHFGDLSDLESMRTVGQIQPCAVVSRAAFLTVYPEHEPTIAGADYVIVAGSRRRAAAERFGLQFLAINIQDQLATTRTTLYAASVAENIDRKNLDVLEEARAVQRLVQESGSGTEAAEILGKTKGWVSQRLSLLKLSREMQDLLVAGDLPIRDARRLAALPVEEQLPAWHEERRLAEQAAHERFTAVNQPAAQKPPAAPPLGQAAAGSTSQNSPIPTRVTRISFTEDASAQEIAELLIARLSAEHLQALVAALTGQPPERAVKRPARRTASPSP